MRNLNFKVTKQILEKVGDFSGLVSGTVGYLTATFEFSEEWDGCLVAASFFDRTGKEYPALIEKGRCEIPEEVLTYKHFRLKLVGIKNNYKITTNEIKVKQEE